MLLPGKIGHQLSGVCAGSNCFDSVCWSESAEFTRKYCQGTSIGANAKESSFAQSKADFIAKLFISLKEAGETEYWLELLYESGYIDKERFDVLYSKNKELIRIITSIIKTTKNNNC